jgi:hypothetical protein
MKAVKYDWFEFGIFGLVRADELPLYRDEIKRLGLKCTAVYFDKTKEEINIILNNM